MAFVSQQSDEPTEADGPLVRRLYQRAGEVDRAAPGRRGGAWMRLVWAAGLALAEDFLRETFVWGTVLLSIVAAAYGATAGDIAWAFCMVVAGVVGVVLVFWSMVRRWAVGRQWAVLLGVIFVQIALIVALWRTH